MKKLMWTLILILLGTETSIIIDNNYVAQAQQPQPETNKVTFECEKAKEVPTIVVKSETKTPVVFLSWIPEYFPQSEIAWEDCQKAAQKLQKIQDEYGNLDSFQLIGDEINNISVVCLIQKRQKCTEDTVLFSLANISETEEVLNKMLNRELLPDTRGDFYLRSVPFRWFPF